MKKNVVVERLRFLLKIARGAKTGVVTFRNGRSPRNFLVRGGRLEILSGPDPTVFLAKLLESSELLKPRRLARVQKAQESEGGCLLTHAVELGYARRDDLVDLLVEEARRELVRLVEEPSASIRFSAGPLDLVPFGEGIEDFLLDRSLEDWTLDAAAGHDAVEVFDLVFPERDEVLSPCGEAATTGVPFDWALDLVDGLRTISEIVAESSRAEFEVMRALYTLERDERLRRREPSELLDLARRFQKEGRLDQAKRFYLLARSLGMDEAQASWDLARSHELMGDGDAAVSEYLKFSRAAEAEGRTEDALRGLRKASELQPDDVLIRESVLRLLDATGAEEEHRRETADLVPLLVDQRCFDRAADLLRRMLGSGALAEGDLEVLARCLRELGRDVRAELLEIVEEREEEGRHGEALALLEFLAATDPDDTDVLLRRGLALSALERDEEAAELIATRADELTIPEEAGDDETWLSRRRRALEIFVAERPDHLPAREWLSRRYERAGRLDRAERHLEALARLQREAGTLEPLCETLENLVEVAPGSSRHVVELGRAYVETGREARGLELLRRAARERLDAGEVCAAAALLDEILGLAPWDLRALEARLDAARREEEEEPRLRLLERGVRLARALDRHDVVLDFLDELDALAARTSERLRLRAECLEQTGEAELLLDALVALARFEAERDNPGAAREACDRGLAIDPDHRELAALRESASASREPAVESVPCGPDATAPAVAGEPEAPAGRRNRSRPRPSVLDLARARATVAHGGPAPSPPPAKEEPPAPDPVPAQTASEPAAEEPVAPREDRQSAPSISGIVARLRSLKP